MKVGIYTLGCKVNTYESEYITHTLKKNNYQIQDFNELCDIYIINTCTVTNTADTKTRKIIRNARKRNKDALIIAVGCYIEANKENLLPEIDIAIGNKDKSKIVDLIEEYLEKKNKITKLYNDFDEHFEDMFITTFENRTRAFVKIQDGCENFCSYCIIPHVRGKCRSKKENIIIDEITSLVNSGYTEIVLTGIHTGNYGVDINSSFAKILRKIIKIKGLKRIRISSIEITELNDEVLNLIKDHDIIVNHLHIPIQSSSNKVLKLMNRKYDLEYYKEKIKEIRSIKKDISITTDIIVGHPGEDNKTFNESLNEINDIAFSKIHVFPYSMRQNTESAKMKQIPDDIKKQNARTLLELSKKLELNYMNMFLNKEVEVLIETNKDNFSYGHTSNYLQIKINKLIPSGTYTKVTLTDIEYPYCIGTI